MQNIEETRAAIVEYGGCSVALGEMLCAEISRLTSELEQARKREIAVRWVEDFAYVGDHFVGSVSASPDGVAWRTIFKHGNEYAFSKPEARAAVEAAVISALGGRGE